MDYKNGSTILKAYDFIILYMTYLFTTFSRSPIPVECLLQGSSKHHSFRNLERSWKIRLAAQLRRSSSWNTCRSVPSRRIPVWRLKLWSEVPNPQGIQQAASQTWKYMKRSWNDTAKVEVDFQKHCLNIVVLMGCYVLPWISINTTKYHRPSPSSFSSFAAWWV